MKEVGFFYPCLPSDFSSSYSCCIIFCGKTAGCCFLSGFKGHNSFLLPQHKKLFHTPSGASNGVVWNLCLKFISSVYSFETVLWMFWMKLPDQFDVLNQAKDLFEDVVDFWVDLNVYIVCTHTLASHWTASSDQTINPLQILTNVND